MHSNRAHNFETGSECLRWCTPALVSDMSSDSEGFFTIKTRTNLPLEFWTLPEQQDLRKKLERKSKPDDSRADPNKEISD